MIMREGHYTEYLQKTLLYMNLGHDLRFMLTVFAICGVVLWTGVTPRPNRAKDVYSVGMWVRTSLKRSTSLRKVGTMVGEPKRVFPATIRCCVPTAH